jgi:hypothetical protein
MLLLLTAETFASTNSNGSVIAWAPASGRYMMWNSRWHLPLQAAHVARRRAQKAPPIVPAAFGEEAVLANADTYSAAAPPMVDVI